MQVGDLVKENCPTRIIYKDRQGVIVDEVEFIARRSIHYPEFSILWLDGTMCRRVQSCNLELVSESR